MNKAAFQRAAAHELGLVLVPMDEDGRELVRAMPPGRAVMLQVRTPRNPRHHRLLFHLIRKVIDGGAWEGDEETLLDWLKIATHQVRTVVGPDGKPYYIPKSISFESMDQAAFGRWFERAVYVVCTRLLGGADWQVLKEEIVEAVDRGLPTSARGRDEAA